MKADVDRDELLSGITKATGALPVRPSTMPVLQNVLLDFGAAADAIRVFATDLEVAVIVEIPAKIHEPGAMTVPGKKFLESLRELPSGDAVLTGSKDNTLTLKSGKARLKIRGTGREDYPQVPFSMEEAGPRLSGGVTVNLESSGFKSAIRRTIVAASRDENRTFLTGANLAIGSKSSSLVSTDGHRLAVSDLSSARGEKKKSASEINVIVPLRILSELAANLPDAGQIEVEVGETAIVFAAGANGIFYSRLIAEKFPDYEKIIPKASEQKTRLPRQKFIEAVQRVSPFSNTRTHAVVLAMKQDKIHFSTLAPEFGEGQDELEAEVKGTPVEFSFNARFLIDGLKAFSGEEILFEYSAKLAPIVLTCDKDPGYKYILMPLRQPS